MSIMSEGGARGLHRPLVDFRREATIFSCENDGDPQMALGKPRGAQIKPKGVMWVRDYQGRSNRMHYILVRNRQITKLIINKQ